MMLLDNGTTGGIYVVASPTSAWTAWNGVYILQQTTSATMTNDATWTQWSNRYASGTTTASGTAATLTTVSDPWSVWNRLYTPSVIIHRALPETAEQRRVREERLRAATEAERQRQVEEAEAKAKAEKLLVEHLSPAQRDQLVKNGYFDVEVAGKVYRIKRGFAGNVELLDDKRQKPVRRFCIHPVERVPDGDAMLGQKLLLEADEAEFLRVANKTNLS